MKPVQRILFLSVIALLLALSSARPLAAQEEAEEAPPAQTLPDEMEEALGLAPEALAAELRPLFQDEAVAELEAWLGLLQTKAQEIRDVELEILGGEALSAQESTDRAVALRIERDALIKRAEVVIKAAEQKGADVEATEQYITSLKGAIEPGGIRALLRRAQVWLLDPEGGVGLALNLGKFLATLFAFAFLARLISRLIGRALARVGKTSELLRNFAQNSARRFVLFIGLIVGLSFLGIDIGPFLAAIGAAGFIIGFALQGTLSNFAAGLMIMFYRPFDIGEVVTTAGVTGKVSSMNLVSTVVKTPDNQTIVVPNGKIWGDVITNVTSSAERRVDLVFGIGYDDDVERAKSILESIVNGHESVLKDPEPVVRLHELADSSVNFVCRPWVKTEDYWDVYWDLTHAVKQRFDAEGISIPYPQQDVHVHQVGASAE